MKYLIVLLFTLICFGVQAQDTIYVKNVFINGKSVKVRNGYILKLSDSVCRVNRRTVRLFKFVETDDPKYSISKN